MGSSKGGQEFQVWEVGVLVGWARGRLRDGGGCCVPEVAATAPWPHKRAAAARFPPGAPAPALPSRDPLPLFPHAPHSCLLRAPPPPTRPPLASLQGARPGRDGHGRCDGGAHLCGAGGAARGAHRGVAGRAASHQQRPRGRRGGRARGCVRGRGADGVCRPRLACLLQSVVTAPAAVQ